MRGRLGVLAKAVERNAIFLLTLLMKVLSNNEAHAWDVYKWASNVWSAQFILTCIDILYKGVKMDIRFGC